MKATYMLHFNSRHIYKQ